MMEEQRLDLWLYYTRLAKTRSLCAAFIRKDVSGSTGREPTRPMHA